MAADSSFLPSSGNTGSGSMLKTPKSPARSRFSKALPAPPPVLEKMLPARTSSRPSTSVDLTDTTHALPPLPPASSAFLSASNNSYIPIASTPATSSAPSAAALPPPPPKSSARPIPGTVTSAPSPSLSLFPHQPPPPPAKTTAPSVLLPAAPAVSVAQLQAPAVPSRAIRRRPVASSVSVASSESNGSLLSGAASPPPQAPAPAPAPGIAALPSVSSLPQLPGLPSFNSFSSLSELPGSNAPAHSMLPEPPELDTSSNSETQSQTKTVRAPTPPPAEEPTSSRVASISSILSAYSEASSIPVGLSSSNSEVTISTNTSSVMATSSSPLRPLAGDKSTLLYVQQPGSGAKMDEDVHTPLSYLLDGDYPDEDDEDEKEAANKVAKEEPVVASVASQSYSNNSDEYDPYSDAYYSYKPPVRKAIKKDDTANVVRINNQTTTNLLNNAPAPPAPISKSEAAALPPRSTSLRNPPPDVMSKTTTMATGALKSDDSLPPLPSLPQHSSSPSEIWKRRSEKAETNLSVTELNLKSTPALQNAIAIAVAADAKADNSDAVQQQQQKQQQQTKDLPPVAPAKDGGYLAYRQPLPPPQSPLPPPPSRSGVNIQLQPPKSPFVAVNANGASPSSLAPSPRLGLPGRDIRPSRQASPALTPTAPQSDAAQPSPNMGASLTKLETKVETSFKRKNLSASSSLPPPPPAKEPQPATVQSPLTSKPQPPPPPPSFQRPPTPEYDEEDKQNDGGNKPFQSKDGASIAPSTKGTMDTSSSSTTVVNVPVSPAASPAASPAGSASPTSFQPPFTREPVSSYDTLEPVTSPRQQPPTPSSSGLVGREIRPVKSTTRLNDQNGFPTNSQPPMSVQPQQPPQQQQQQFAPRTSSRNVSISTVPGALAGPVPPSKRMPATVPDHQHGNSAMSVVSETGSQVTIKAVAQKLPAPDGQDRREMPTSGNDIQRPMSSTSADLPLAPGMPPLFPSGYMTDLITPDTVFAAPPPSKIQFNCLQRHNDMFRDRNVNYPLSCQACQTFERSMRWRCKWCYVRICSGCRDALHTHAKHDLAQLMTYLEEGGAKDAVIEEAFERDGKTTTVQSISSASELPAIQEA
ncbi:hypothetical protein SEUCBS139899_005356 [Sporothrix eucalyptigena]